MSASREIDNGRLQSALGPTEGPLKFRGPMWWNLKTPCQLIPLAEAAKGKAKVERALAETILQATLTLLGL